MRMWVCLLSFHAKPNQQTTTSMKYCTQLLTVSRTPFLEKNLFFKFIAGAIKRRRRRERNRGQPLLDYKQKSGFADIAPVINIANAAPDTRLVWPHLRETHTIYTSRLTTLRRNTLYAFEGVKYNSTMN